MELVEVLLLLLLQGLLVVGGGVLVVLVFSCWLRRLVCCSRRDWTLLLPSALPTNKPASSKHLDSLTHTAG